MEISEFFLEISGMLNGVQIGAGSLNIITNSREI